MRAVLSETRMGAAPMGAPQSIRSAGGVPAQCLRCCSGVRAEPCGDARSSLRGRHRNGAAARSRVQRAAVGWRSTSSTCCRRARPVPQLPTCTRGWGAPACTPLPAAPNSSSAPNPRSGCARAVSTLLSAGVGGCRAATSGIAPHAVLPRHAGCAVGLSAPVSSSIGALTSGIPHALPRLQWDAAPLPSLHTFSPASAPESCSGGGCGENRPSWCHVLSVMACKGAAPHQALPPL